MYQGKFSKSRKKRSAAKRPVAVLVSLALILLVGIGTTIAFIQTETPAVENTFTPAEVPPTIEETFPAEHKLKSDVKVTNSGNVSAYIRAAIVVTWQDSEGNVAPEAPVKDTDYKMELAASGWVKKGDYYYYTQPVAAKGTTTNLINQAYQLKAKDGYQLHIEIMAQTIQAEGTDALGNKPIELAWGVDFDSDGNLVAATIVTEGGNG